MSEVISKPGRSPVKLLDISKPIEVTYCIPVWLRDQQVKQACERPLPRILPVKNEDRGNDPIAVVAFGPSLNDTWEKLRDFRHVMTCSGSHKFLVERGIIPTWHVEVDPRPHKVKLIGPPHKDVEYLIASTCHASVFDHLNGFNVKLWHVFANEEDVLRALPHGEWALTGGCSVGLRAMTVARFLGFTNQHYFGMDGCEGASGKHAAEHPNQPEGHSIVELDGVRYRTTPGMAEAARQTFHELNQMPDVKATFYGEGLTQALARNYVPNPVGSGKAMIGFSKPELISAQYRELNRKLHHANLAYGVGGDKHAPMVLKLAESLKTTSILDYGCGKGLLAKSIPFPIWEYDPGMPGKEESPRPADLVVCTDVLEHIEPDKLDFVLDDIRRCMKKIGYFVIHTGPSGKTLADGRNSHLIQEGKAWWYQRLSNFFGMVKNAINEKPPLLYVVVYPKKVSHA